MLVAAGTDSQSSIEMRKTVHCICIWSVVRALNKCTVVSENDVPRVFAAPKIRTPENPHRGLIPKSPKFGGCKMAIFGDLDETFVPKNANLGGIRCF